MVYLKLRKGWKLKGVTFVHVLILLYLRKEFYEFLISLPNSLNFFDKETLNQEKLSSVDLSRYVTYYDGSIKIKDPPLILFWTTYYSTYWSMFYKHFNRNRCRPWTCKLTNDRRMLNVSDVIVFSIGDLRENDLPQYRREDQIWVAFTREPPFNIRIENQFGLKLYNHMFNWTATYRTDSDVTYTYGNILSRNTQAKTKPPYPWLVDKNEIHERFIKDFDPQPLDFDEVERNLPERNGSALWAVSNCASWYRLKFVKELKKYMDVEIFGECGTGRSKKTWYIDETKYKYYLAFENSKCRDYVTEKMLRTFKYNIIPVVRGGADYQNIAPPRSYINVDDYENPRALAEYLKYLNRNHTAYMEYFLWKKDFYEVNMHAFPCRFCEALKKPIQKKSYNDLDEYYFGNSGCTDYK